MRYYGKVGFVKTVEKALGVWEPEVTEKTYYGDVLENHRRWSSSDKVTDDLFIDNKISIIADDFAYSNLGCMQYIEFSGALWKISKAELARPRIIITLGGVYNGESAPD